ncbi:MAG: hydrogenase maturation nickel metallochaperone HypA [Anaerolineae bacterium]|jgi:hydrogenase nickel incorporation protein HypA/HybF|nr:hydrogenase maturation nickel metallochaperone HypA [Anaerolineae bacterium]MBT7188779.1 hydrogenase maturation nickel metallochaperone HypA [Anaerolineae bacterium]MBT7991176.1 hydrogenase maturation nickel metallochaperone HypA [Anaerolineae bacterium]
MHELPVTESILDITLRHAKTHNATKVTDIYLVIGDWSSIIDDSVQFHWDILSENTIAQAATLHFERISIELFCLDCSHTYTPTDRELVCPKCESSRIKVVKGDEFNIDSIEIEN